MLLRVFTKLAQPSKASSLCLNKYYKSLARLLNVVENKFSERKRWLASFEESENIFIEFVQSYPS